MDFERNVSRFVSYRVTIAAFSCAEVAVMKPWPSVTQVQHLLASVIVFLLPTYTSYIRPTCSHTKGMENKDISILSQFVVILVELSEVLTMKPSDFVGIFFNFH